MNSVVTMPDGVQLLRFAVVLGAISDTTKNMLSEDSTFKEYLMHFVKEADFNISDIKIKKMAALFGHRLSIRSARHFAVT